MVSKVHVIWNSSSLPLLAIIWRHLIEASSFRQCVPCNVVNIHFVEASRLLWRGPIGYQFGHLSKYRHFSVNIVYRQSSSKISISLLIFFNDDFINFENQKHLNCSYFGTYIYWVPWFCIEPISMKFIHLHFIYMVIHKLS